MDRIEIKVNEIIIADLEKLIEKYQKKAEKEREKVKSAYVTYKGEKYYSDAELMDAYACDAFTEKTYDRLLDKLNKAKSGVSNNEMTESEQIVIELNKHKRDLRRDIVWDSQQKEKQAQIDARICDLTEQGYSIREAKTIIGNEELMRYE